MNSKKDTTELFYKNIVEGEISEEIHKIEFMIEPVLIDKNRKISSFKLKDFYICTTAGGIKRRFRKMVFGAEGISDEYISGFSFTKDTLEFIEFLKNLIFVDNKKYFNFEEGSVILPSLAFETGMRYIEEYARNYQEATSYFLESYILQEENFYIISFKNLTKITLMANKYSVLGKENLDKTFMICKEKRENFTKIKYLKDNFQKKDFVRLNGKNICFGEVLKSLGEISKITFDKSLKDKVIIPRSVNLKIWIRERKYNLENLDVELNEIIAIPEFLYNGLSKDDYGDFTVLQNGAFERMKLEELRKNMYLYGFERREDVFLLKNEDETIYNFMTNYINLLSSQYKVVLSKDLKKRKYEKLYPQISVTMGEELYIKFSIKGIVRDEVAEVLKDVAKKKKYYKSKKKGIFNIENAGFFELVELLTGLDATEKEICAGAITREKSFLPFIKNTLKDIYSKKDIDDKKMKKAAEKNKNKATNTSPIFKELRLYQKKGVNDLINLKNENLGGILADEFGMGKTVQMISFLQTCQNETYNLIIVHSYMIKSWCLEFKKFAPDMKIKVVIGEAEERARILERAKPDEILLTSYELFRNDYLKYEFIQFDNVIYDEPLYLKRRDKFLEMVQILKFKNCFCMTSGFSWENLMDIYYLFELVKLGYLGSRNSFRAKYVGAKKSEEKYMLDILSALVRPYLIYRKREEVSKELPKITSQYIELEMDTNDKYRMSYISYVQKIHRFLLFENRHEKISIKKVYTFLTRIGQLCSYPGVIRNNFKEENKKTRALRDLLVIAAKENSKVVVISNFSKNLKMFKSKFPKNILEIDKGLKMQPFFISKNVSEVRREKIYKNFNEKYQDKSAVLFTTQISNKELSNLEFDMLIYFDPPWKNKMTNIGEKQTYKKKVYEINMILKGSIEEKIYYNMRKLIKNEVVAKIINTDEKDILKNSREEFTREQIFEFLQL